MLRDDEPDDTPQVAPTETTTGQYRPAVRQQARVGWRCVPHGAVGRTEQGLLVVCGPDRRGRDRWRPMSPATRHLFGVAASID
jgi:hypothetical protein